MRNLFPGSYSPTEKDFAKMWAEAMFVFDTNMLLNVYRYSEDTRREFLGLVSGPEISDRIWIPYQVAMEYHRNLDEVRYEPIRALGDIKQAITKSGQTVRAGDHKHRVDSLLKIVGQLLQEAEEQYRHPGRRALIDTIADLFDGKVGREWTPEELKAVYKSGEERYAKKIPPGFGDASQKKGDDRYGDLVIWFQIVEHATEKQKPVIFVTDDIAKDDWWLRVGGKTLGPLPELIREMDRKAHVSFYMYSGDRFLEQARSSLKRAVRDETVAEVKQVRVEQQERQLDSLDRAIADQQALVQEAELVSGIFRELQELIGTSENDRERAMFIARIGEVGRRSAELNSRREAIARRIAALKVERQPDEPTGSRTSGRKD